MKHRKAFNLQYPLALWNFLLAICSIYGAYEIIPQFFHFWIYEEGFIAETCGGDVEVRSPVTMIFCLSKIPELFDTVFIVLRKKPLRFLQYYHHIATMAYCWIAWAYLNEIGGVFAAMNLFVHSFMYTYFMCSALHWRWPNWARITLTMMQLAQMAFGVSVLLISIYKCPYYLKVNVTLGLLMYATYFYLFARLFYEMYLGPRQEPYVPTPSKLSREPLSPVRGDGEEREKNSNGQRRLNFDSEDNGSVGNHDASHKVKVD